MGTVVISGANRGIGLEFVRQYAEAGWQVYALCRHASDELNSVGVKVVDGVEITSPESIDYVRQKLSGVSVDLLINNAGILRDEQFGELDFESILEQFNVNTLGALRLTEALLGNFSSGSKIAIITSRMGSIADNSSGGRYGYRMSKAALNIASVSLAKDLASEGIAVAILHPGYVQTDMVGNRGDISAKEAAHRLICRIEELNLENSGSFWHSNGEQLPW